VHVDRVPMPPAVRAGPRDTRGYPVPATTPWEGDEPQFALTDYGRSADCAHGRLCSVCNTLIPRGPAWRVVGGTEAAAIGEALAAGRPYARNRCAGRMVKRAERFLVQGEVMRHQVWGEGGRGQGRPRRDRP
jgi:hypothetical protein